MIHIAVLPPAWKLHDVTISFRVTAGGQHGAFSSEGKWF
jgi:hypothetical protein